MLIVDNPKECDTNDVFKAKKMTIDKWKDYAKQNTATIDIVIFKMVISEGWDIPRACMLYQIRDSQSLQLDEQVIGRVRRNPKLLTFETLSSSAQDLAMKAWVWGVMPKDHKKIYSVKLQNNSNRIIDNFKLKTTRIKTLMQRDNFKLDEFLNSINPKLTNLNIFELNKRLNKSNDDIKKMCYEYADSYSKWWQFTENIEKIAHENDKFICDYAVSMELTKDDNECIKEVSFPNISSYVDNGNYLNISDWVWYRCDGKDKFSFDSEAEREWASILKDLTIRNIPNTLIKSVKEIEIGKENLNTDYINMFDGIELDEIDVYKKFLWGKNYILNSSIKYEYYLDGIHSSYPDFIMKDSYDRIHIFEVKSVNISNTININFDDDKYKLKILELKKCYKQASILTGHIFYLPILKDDVWYITQFVNGNERSMTKEQFINFVMTQNKENN